MRVYSCAEMYYLAIIRGGTAHGHFSRMVIVSEFTLRNISLGSKYKNNISNAIAKKFHDAFT